jgi:septum formation protein
MQRIILASASPARRHLLETIGLAFTIEPSLLPEVMDEATTPEALAVRLALGKARDVASRNPDAIIIAADSFVILDGRYLGKPHSAEEARAMLRHESGKAQRFVTGLAVIDAATGQEFIEHELSEIRMSELSDEEIEEYIATGEPFGKAGAYGIQGQGAVFIAEVRGSYAGIIGLPVNKLYRILRQLGVDIFHK